MGGANPSFLKWLVTSLRSGHYKQIRGQLRSDDGYDVLGVAVDLLVQCGELPAWKRLEYPGGVRYQAGEHDTTVIPFVAAHAMGITQDLKFPAGYTDEHFEYTFESALELSDDTDYSFSEIADAIVQAFGLEDE